jgi:hypothetical protein
MFNKEQLEELLTKAGAKAKKQIKIYIDNSDD